MIHLGLALDDAAFALARDGSLLGDPTPSIVVAGARAGSLRMGESATAIFRTAPTAVSTRHWLEIGAARAGARALEVARAELAVRFAGAGLTPAGCALQVAVPAAFDARGLSLVLAALRRLGVTDVAFIDAAALASAALGLHGTALLLEVGLHHVGATRVEAVGEDCRRRSAAVRSTRGGRVALMDAWLTLVSEAMVLSSRFDPLNDAQVEQELYERLPGIAAEAARTGSVVVALEARGTTHAVTLSRDQFAARAEPVFRELIDIVHEQRPAGAAVTLLADQGLALLPGFREALVQFVGCRLLLLPPGLTAIAAARMERADADPAHVRFTRGVHRFSPPLVFEGQAAAELLGDPGAPATAPTHVLWAGHAIALRSAVGSGTAAGASGGGEALVIEIGRSPAPGGITLPEGLAGVSRLHCSLRSEGADVLVVDHSRHGSFLNDERVAGRARLHAGDRLRLGDPGVELELIAVGQHAAAP
jgi:hypothetical protein